MLANPFKTIKAQIPFKLHHRFKEACRKKDTNITTVLIRLISNYVKDAESR
jgi:hypothetical protein